MSQSAFGARFGVKQQTWANYERGERSPSLDLLSQIGVNEGIDLHWLLTGSGDMKRTALARIDSVAAIEGVEELRRERDHLQHELEATRRYEGSPTVRVPVFDVPLEAGRIDPTARATEIDALVSYETAYREWLRKECGVDPDRAFMAPVHGQSMEDLLFDGDWILGEQQDHVDRDGIFAVVLNGSMLIKYVQRGRKRGTLDLISRNPAFPAYTASVDAGDSFYVIGRYARRITR